MSAKIILGKRPANFFLAIAIALLEGGEGTVGINYKYRTRTEFGAFIDGLRAGTDAAVPVVTQGETESSLVELWAKTKTTQADYILQIADGWDLAPAFTRENVAQLCDELPGAALAIISRYRDAVLDGRLGN
jgi:hypothetical protein